MDILFIFCKGITCIFKDTLQTKFKEAYRTCHVMIAILLSLYTINASLYVMQYVALLVYL